MKRWLQAAAVIAAAGILAGTAGISWSNRQEKAQQEQALEYTELKVCLIGNAPYKLNGLYGGIFPRNTRCCYQSVKILI